MTNNIIEHGYDLEIGSNYFLHDNYIGTSFSLCVKSLIKKEIRIRKSYTSTALRWNHSLFLLI